MTAPEPLRLTLEEAFSAVRTRDPNKIVSVRYYPFAHYPWRVETASGRVEVFEEWPPAFSHALDRPVVARDDAAELRAALAAATDALDRALTSLLHHSHERQHRVHTELLPVYDEVCAALAATEGGD